MYKYLLTTILGIVVGLLGGFQGITGSTYIIVGLLLFGIVPSQREAASTALLVTMLPLRLLAIYQYYKMGDVRIDLAIILIISIFIFSYRGARLNYEIPKKYVYYSTGITTLLSSLYFFYKGINN